MEARIRLPRRPHAHAWALCVAGVALCFFFCAAPNRASAQQRDIVYFAGVAFTGDAVDSASQFPNLSSLLADGGNVRLNQQIRLRLQSRALPMDVSFDKLGSIRDASRSTALALAIDRETTSVEHIGDLYKVRVEIAAQALFFDFKEKQVLGGFPLILVLVDTPRTRPSDEYIKHLFSELVFGGPDTNTTLSAQFALTLARARVPSAATRHLRVSAVTLQPRALEYIRQYGDGETPSAIEAQIAQAFGTYLAANQQLSLLPYRSNQALGSSMATRFIEGDAYQLTIPDADYDIKIDIPGFKRVIQGQNTIERLLLYGAFVDLTVSEPLSGKVYFSQRIRQGSTKHVPLVQTNVDDWAASYETLLILFDNFTQAISSPGGDWARSALPTGEASKSQLSSLTELINSCR
jgi:hypothetical protein